MNSIYHNRFSTQTVPEPSLRRLQLACAPCYEAVVDGLSTIRSRIERKFSAAVAGYEQVLNSALTEAEALAWQTPYPHLLFPALAEEKAATVQQWAEHQQAVYARGQIRAFAA